MPFDNYYAAAVAEAVPETAEPPLFTVYQTAGAGSRDDRAGSVYGTDPVEALEAFAAGIGVTDYSIDQDGGRVFLCPAHSRLRFYVYAL